MLFIFTVQYVFLNLFVLVVTEQFETYQFNHEDNPLRIFAVYFECFKQAWIIFARKNDGLKITEKELMPFFLKLGKPLGFPPGTKSLEVAKEIQKMELNADHLGFVYFHEVLFASIKRVLSQRALAAGDEATRIHCYRCEMITKAYIEALTRRVSRCFV